MKVKHFLLGLLIILFGCQAFAEMTQEQQKMWFMNPANPISPFNINNPANPNSLQNPNNPNSPLYRKPYKAEISKPYVHGGHTTLPLQSFPKTLAPTFPKTSIIPPIIYLGDGRCQKKEDGIIMSFECEKANIIRYNDGCMRGRFPDGKFLGIRGTILPGPVGASETCLIEELSDGKCWGYWGPRWKDKLLSCSTLESISQ